MQIIHHMTIDMARPLPTVPVDAVQGDGNTRLLRLSLLENGESWAVPEGVTAAVAFRKSDGTKGLYDTLPDGTKAVSIDGNAVSAILAPQVLTCAGQVSAAVVFHDRDMHQLATFPFAIRVAGNPGAGQAVSNGYYRYSTMEAVTDAVESALARARAITANTAPAIVCQASGTVISVTGGAYRPLEGLTLYGKTLQSGTPAPDNPAAPVSLGAGGSIAVEITDGTGDAAQTLTLQTPNGLPGIPVTSGGNYTDPAGQQWVCDEIDLARGVHVKRLTTLHPTEVGQTYKGAHGCLCFAVAEGALPLGPSELGAVMCSHGTAVIANAQYSSRKNSVSVSNGKVFLCIDGITTREEAGRFLAGNDVTLVFQDAAPTEIPLPAEELAAFAALHSYFPSTTVRNDGGAQMDIRYVADTKTYIDVKLAGK